MKGKDRIRKLIGRIATETISNIIATCVVAVLGVATIITVVSGVALTIVLGVVVGIIVYGNLGTAIGLIQAARREIRVYRHGSRLR